MKHSGTCVILQHYGDEDIVGGGEAESRGRLNLSPMNAACQFLLEGIQ